MKLTEELEYDIDTVGILLKKVRDTLEYSQVNVNNIGYVGYRSILDIEYELSCIVN